MIACCVYNDLWPVSTTTSVAKRAVFCYYLIL
jgi:hypothetical protein